MSGSASISGLASGLDTATLISQLMQLEAAPQTRLRSRASREQLEVNALQTLNARIASLATQARDLTRPTSWNALTATSTLTAVSVVAGPTATPGGFSLRVDRTAAAHRLEHASAVGLDAAGTTPASVRLDRLDGTAPLDLTTDGTLRGLVSAINDPLNATGLRATAVRVGADEFRLVVESAGTGAAGDFSLTDASSGDALLGGAVVRPGRDAQVTVGEGIMVTSTTNTFADLAPGLTVTLGAAATGSGEVSVAADPDAMVARVKSVVEAVNATLAEIDSLTAFNPAGKTAGLLNGDSGVRDVRSVLLATVFSGDGATMADVGIQTDRTGRLVLDEARLRESFVADPADVRSRLAGGSGLMDRIAAAASAASDKYTGSLTTAIAGRTTSIRRLNDGVEAWDDRLEMRRATLTRQFTALETALSQMNSQSAWLAGQISSLPTSGS
ncbi:flagellar filament capping protein FliD [Mycobacterium cookii]|uniref:Flagellar hook-associated protein 2 n=1 Tax=Nocardioides furvisabuli TaxID=375542 RepID=A0ABP5IHV4_9ACTN|nr:flagellar filament capping protein FliD [Nocardioides furvisabuli]